MKRTSTVLACIILILNLIAGSVSAADIYGSAEYKPLDMVVVVDTSGSMNYSDSTHMTSSAINMLINMMPAEESRLGIVTFNTKPTALTCDASGNPALLSLKEFDNVKNIKQKVSEIVYKGDTGIGNAIKMATDMLANGSNDSDRRKAILLFTDGVDDFGSDQLGLARCKENQGTAVQWATENKCPIYCIGYNYRTSSGGNSMGKNGEGITKLENIAKPTGGQAKAITNIKEIEDMFISMLANICDLYYKVVEVVPGDGKRHEVSIQVSPEVIEANVRITCATKDALSKGTIELYNPQNEKVALQNGNGIRYDVDATAASIKVLSPKTGTWTLVLDGITGEEIKIGLLEHYELGIVSKLTLPEGNPDGVGYIGDEIGVQAYLTTDGSQVTDTAIYETITTARVVVTPRAAPEQQEIYALTFDGIQYNGSFTIPLESVYDVTVELGSESFIRTDSLVIQSNNHPLVLDKNIENVKLNKNKQIVISDIYTYVSDPEQDAITAEVTNLTDPDMAKVEIKDDQIIIDGLGWGATNATVTYTDAHGNTVTSTFKVSVNDPVAWAIIIGLIILLVAIVLLFVYLGYKKTLIVGGTVQITEFGTKSISHGITMDIASRFELESSVAEEQDYGMFGEEKDAPFDIGELNLDELLNNNTNIDFDSQETVQEFDEKAHHNIFESKVNLKQFACKNMNDVLLAFAQKYEDHMTLGGTRRSEMAIAVRQFIENELYVMRDINILGTRFGRQGIIFKLVKDSRVDKKGFTEDVYKTNTNVNETTRNIEFTVPTNSVDEDGGEIYLYVKFDYRNAN